MTELAVFTTGQKDEWMQAIERCAPYDFYHLAFYHALAEHAGEGGARLLVYTEGPHTIALPLLLRNLDELTVSKAIGPGWHDATSVYGYPGPISSGEPIPQAVIHNFHAALRAQMRDWRVVTMFSRLHPLLNQRPLLAGLGSFQTSQTISVDLTLPGTQMRSKYRKTLKDAILKLQRLGVTTVRDTDGRYFDDFIRIYYETMRRVKAADRYFFPASYFEELRQGLGPRLQLFMCLDGTEPLCGGLFVACHGILQHHLGGTSDAALQMAPMKLLIDEVCNWGAAEGLRVLHLGGGATPNPQDSLLYFKRAFSDRRHEFASWRWIVAPEQDALLCAENARLLDAQGLHPASTDFFPGYRCPPSRREVHAPELSDAFAQGQPSLGVPSAT